MKTFRLMTLFAIAIAACGPEGSGTSSDNNPTGAGNSGAGAGSTSSSSSSTGNGGSGASGDMCYPSIENNWCAEAEACACKTMVTTDPEWCDQWMQDGVNVCNGPPANTCEPGLNRCGYDLPMGEAYVEPDPTCRLYVSGDTWIDEDFNEGPVSSGTNPNGQLGVDFLMMGAPSGYFSGFIMSGTRLYWNRGNSATAESAEGQFSPDCQSINMAYFEAGASAPSLTQTANWLGN